MLRSLLIVLSLVAVACGGDTSPSTSAPPTTTTTRPPTTLDAAATSASPTTGAPTTTTEAPATTVAVETTVATTEGSAAIRIEELVLAGEPYVVIGNGGDGAGSTDGYWICQFPSYYALPDVALQPGEKLAVPLGEAPVPDLVGVVATVDVIAPLGVIDAADGELGLYSANQFNSADAIVDYLEWGTADHARSGVAVAAGIWVEGGFVEVPAEVLAIVAQRFPTTTPDDWFAEIGG